MLFWCSPSMEEILPLLVCLLENGGNYANLEGYKGLGKYYP